MHVISPHDRSCANLGEDCRRGSAGSRNRGVDAKATLSEGVSATSSHDWPDPLDARAELANLWSDLDDFSPFRPARENSPTARAAMANKVPEITLIFWVRIKIMSTTVGETGADYFAGRRAWDGADGVVIVSFLSF